MAPKPTSSFLKIVFVIFLSVILHAVKTLPQEGQFGYDSDIDRFGGYSKRKWDNLYKHGSPSKKIGGGDMKPFAQYGSASFYLRSSYGPYYVIGKWKDRFQEQQIGFTLKEWDKDRELDGFLCRNIHDCLWADPQFDCQQYDISPEFLKGSWKGWTNGTRSYIAGECACRSGFYFDDISLSCQETTYGFNPVWFVVGIAILILVLLLCCRFGVFCIFKE